MSKKVATLLVSCSITLCTLTSCEKSKNPSEKEPSTSKQPTVTASKKVTQSAKVEKSTSKTKAQVAATIPKVPLEKPTKDDVIKLYRMTSKETKFMAGAKWDKFIKVLKLATELQDGKYLDDAAVEWTKAYKLIFEINDENRREVLANGDLKLGKVTLHVDSKEISFPAKMIFPTEMPIEVICCRKYGRLHEALTVTEARPLHIQTLLHAIEAHNGYLTANNPKMAQGDLADFFLEYTDAKGKLQRRPVEYFLTDDKTSKWLPSYGWVFLGSVMSRGVFVADATGDIAVSFSAGGTIFNVNNEMLAKGENHCSAVARDGLKTDSPVRFIIKVRPRKSTKSE